MEVAVLELPALERVMKLSPAERAAVFWAVCVPTRGLLLAHADRVWVRAFATAASVMWLTQDMGHIGAFGGVAWWADARPVHGVLWGLYALSGARALLGVDLLYGTLRWFVTRP